MKYGLQALDIPNDPTRGLRDVLLIHMIPVLKEKRADRLFIGVDVEIVPVERFPLEQREGLKQQLKLLDDEQKRVGGLSCFMVFAFDRVSGVSNVCGMGFGEDVLRMERGLPWQEPLLYALNVSHMP